MPRTLDPTAHAHRRDEFIDAAQRLMQTKGFDEVSVREVLDDIGASKGAFYHYFGSKADLLEAVVDRMVDGATASVELLLEDPRVPASEKLVGLFAGITSWKNARRDLLLSLMRAWTSDENAIAREKFRRKVADRITPLLAPVISQGVGEGVYASSSPLHTAGVFVSLMLGLNEAAVRLYLARAAGEVTLDEIARTFASYVEGLERILGASPGSLPVLDDATLRLWFA